MQKLRDAGNAALAAGDVASANRMFSMGIDAVLGRGAKGKAMSVRFTSMVTSSVAWHAGL